MSTKCVCIEHTYRIHKTKQSRDGSWRQNPNFIARQLSYHHNSIEHRLFEYWPFIISKEQYCTTNYTLNPEPATNCIQTMNRSKHKYHVNRLNIRSTVRWLILTYQLFMLEMWICVNVLCCHRIGSLAAIAHWSWYTLDVKWKLTLSATSLIIVACAMMWKYTVKSLSHAFCSTNCPHAWCARWIMLIVDRRLTIPMLAHCSVLMLTYITRNHWNRLSTKIVLKAFDCLMLFWIWKFELRHHFQKRRTRLVC